jgi:hypothetical protein
MTKPTIGIVTSVVLDVAMANSVKTDPILEGLRKLTLIITMCLGTLLTDRLLKTWLRYPSIMLWVHLLYLGIVMVVISVWITSTGVYLE